MFLNISNSTDFNVAQRNLMLRYIKENGLSLYDEYIDDGVSRYNFW